MNANTVPVISGDLQRKTVDLSTISNMHHLIKSFAFANAIPTENEPSKVDLLIGSGYHSDHIHTKKHGDALWTVYC